MIKNRRIDRTATRIIALLALVYFVYLIYQGVLSFVNNVWPVYTYLFFAGEIIELAAVVALIYAVFSSGGKEKLLIPCVLTAAAFVFATMSSVFILSKGAGFPDLWRQLIFKAAGLVVFIFISVDAGSGSKRVKADFILLAIYWIFSFFSRIIAMMNAASAHNLQTALMTYIIPSFFSASFIILLILLQNMSVNKRGGLSRINQKSSDQAISLDEQLEMLDKQYAQGQITYKEYTEKRKEILRQA